jgi:4-amino-4-deoxy-L-arabinose transferase-like glycosyltransferase
MHYKHKSECLIEKNYDVLFGALVCTLAWLSWASSVSSEWSWLDERSLISRTGLYFSAYHHFQTNSAAYQAFYSDVQAFFFFEGKGFG